MREIKFRVFAGYKMEYFGLGDTVPYYYKDENSSATKYEPVMQYTGLLDKNGKEIYEGDIVNCSFVYRNSELEIFEAVEVEFDPLWGTTISPHDVYSLGRCKDIEVIGNIYENSNLLK